MDTVATAAAVAKPTLYRYFPTKEALFIASLEWTLEDLRAALHKARLEPAPNEIKLRRLIAMVLGRIEHLAPAIHAIESQNAQWGKESQRILRQGFQKLQEEVSGLIRDGQRDNQFAEIDPDLVLSLPSAASLLNCSPRSSTLRSPSFSSSMAHGCREMW